MRLYSHCVQKSRGLSNRLALLPVPLEPFVEVVFWWVLAYWLVVVCWLVGAAGARGSGAGERGAVLVVWCLRVVLGVVYDRVYRPAWGRAC